MAYEACIRRRYTHAAIQEGSSSMPITGRSKSSGSRPLDSQKGLLHSGSGGHRLWPQR